MYGLFSPLWLLLPLVFLVAGFLGIGASVIGARRRGIDTNYREVLSVMAGLTRFTVSRMAASITILPMISLALFGALCWTHGYYYSSNQRAKERYTYTEVLIMARNSATSFTVQPARMEPWELADLCDAEDWQQWEKMSQLTFSVKTRPDGTRCKDAEMGGSYVFYMKDGKRLLYPPQETLSNARY